MKLPRFSARTMNPRTGRISPRVWMAGLGTMTLYDARRLGRAWLRWVERTQKWADEAREFRRMRKGKAKC